MNKHEKILEEIDEALKNPKNVLGSCAPEKGQSYSCMNCVKMSVERDGCFTEYMEKYGYAQQKDRCPGYEPPKNGIFLIVMQNVDLKN